MSLERSMISSRFRAREPSSCRSPTVDATPVRRPALLVFEHFIKA